MVSKLLIYTEFEVICYAIRSKGIVHKPCTCVCVTDQEKLHLGVHVTNGSLIGVEVTKHWHMIKDIMTYEVHMGDTVSHG